MEKRGGALIDIDKELLAVSMKLYFDPQIELEKVVASRPSFGQHAAGYDPKLARQKLLKNDSFNNDHLVRYAARPFDTRWAYYSAVNPLWNRSRPALWEQFKSGNRFLISRVRSTSGAEGHPIGFTKCLLDDHYAMPDAVGIPFVIKSSLTSDLLQTDTKLEVANLSDAVCKYFKSLSVGDTDPATAELIWMHALAIGYSPAYLSDNADGIRENWPRIPLPASRDALLASAALGREVAALLDTEVPVPGVTSGTLRPELKTIAVVSRVGGGALKVDEFALTAGWGSGGSGKPVMPGVGRVELNSGSPHPNPLPGGEGINPEGARAGKSLDVYLNATAYWQNVPQAVWDFTIGGYQVMKKWLSYREQRVLGRALTMAEIMEVTAMARRLAALVLLQAVLDANYKAVTAATWSFGRMD